MNETYESTCWHGKFDVRVDTVPDPVIQEPTDATSKSLLPRFADRSPSLRRLHGGDGEKRRARHEPMGIVVEVGSSVTKLREDRVVAFVSPRLLLHEAALRLLRHDESRRGESA
jgi:threonine dehydrogenase-like Zn-dependent dehydrogenase